jgi:hypothetical protein
MVMLGYNLMSLFRQSILESNVQYKLSNLRYSLFAMGGYMIKEDNHRILKLSLTMKRRSGSCDFVIKHHFSLYKQICKLNLLLRNLG